VLQVVLFTDHPLAATAGVLVRLILSLKVNVTVGVGAVEFEEQLVDGTMPLQFVTATAAREAVIAVAAALTLDPITTTAAMARIAAMHLKLFMSFPLSFPALRYRKNLGRICREMTVWWMRAKYDPVPGIEWTLEVSLPLSV
jgi:hypothetical protein